VSRTETFKVADVLEALDGVAYLVGRDGVIRALGQSNWERFAHTNNAPPSLTAGAVLGQDLMAFIQGEAVRDAYRQVMQRVAESGAPFSFAFRCDSPGIRRRFRMSISPLRGGAGEVDAFLFQSVVLNTWDRVPVPLMNFAALAEQAMAEPDRPFLGMCSYCQKVRWPVGSKDGDGEWIEAEAYYRRGGTSRVQISHGVCRPCFDRVVMPVIRGMPPS